MTIDDAPFPEPVWDTSWDERTAELAYEASLPSRESLSAWADSLDTKLLGVFAVGGVILTIAPTLQASNPNRVVVGLWVLAAISWLFALAFGLHGYRPTVLRVGPDPQEFLKPIWLKKSPLHFRLWQIAEMADSFRRNHATLKLKAEALKWALRFTAIEVLALATAFVFSSACG
jgi:hypothetical protein